MNSTTQYIRNIFFNIATNIKILVWYFTFSFCTNLWILVWIYTSQFKLYTFQGPRSRWAAEATCLSNHKHSMCKLEVISFLPKSVPSSDVPIGSWNHFPSNDQSLNFLWDSSISLSLNHCRSTPFSSLSHI